MKNIPSMGCHHSVVNAIIDWINAHDEKCHNVKPQEPGSPALMVDLLFKQTEAYQSLVNELNKYADEKLERAKKRLEQIDEYIQAKGTAAKDLDISKTLDLINKYHSTLPILKTEYPRVTMQQFALWVKVQGEL